MRHLCYGNAVKPINIMCNLLTEQIFEAKIGKNIVFERLTIANAMLVTILIQNMNNTN